MNARRDRSRAVISGANPISLNERPRAGAFARVGKTQIMARTAARSGALRLALRYEIGAPRGRRPIRKRSNEKARDRFPGAGSILNSCDDEDMPVICPTGQVFCKRKLF
jgi:hypothetical protein